MASALVLLLYVRVPVREPFPSGRRRKWTIPDGRLKNNLGDEVNINRHTEHTAIVIILPTINRQLVGSCFVVYVVA
jgi:hypothetical protein